MATPTWIEHTDLIDFAAHPGGNPDVSNLPGQEFYATIGNEHNDDGTHKIADFCTAEEDNQAGDGNDDRDVSLTNTSLDVIFAIVLSDAASYPTLRTTDMTGDKTKILGTDAHQNNMIQSLATTGEIQLGTDAAVNAAGTNYDYSVFGTGK